MSETLTIFGTQFTGVIGIKATDSNNQIKTYIIPQGNISITNNGNNIDVTNYATASVNVGSLPTQHMVHLEFTDSTDTDMSAYYSNSLIGTMITTYTPTTYNNKTVDTAELDEVEWYARPTITWTTIKDEIMTFQPEPDDSYVWISDLASLSITEGSVWRVTFGNTTRIHTAVYGKPFPDSSTSFWHINSTTDGTNGVYSMWNSGSAWIIADFNDTSNHTQYVKIEQGTTSS